MRRSLVFFWLLVLAIPLAARNQRPINPPTIAVLPDAQLRVHRASNILFSVTNFGVFGSQDGMFPDQEGIFPYAPGVQFPAYSNLNYLFLGAIWIGGIIDTVDSNGRPLLDTLVSVGSDGWWGNIFELFPPLPGTTSMWRDQIISDEEIFAFYFDTVTTINIVLPDPVDGRPHIPLGVKVHQHSICWSSSGYNEIFIIEYAIENIYNRPIHDVWLGIYYDGDVYHNSENPYAPEQGAQDDLTGFIERGSNGGIAWLADNDGQPYNGQFDYRSPTGVIGIRLLHPLDGTQANFNWWMSSIDSAGDWGPQWQSNFDRWGTFPGGGRGTPGGDRAKYKVMSNGEHDYDQAQSALIHNDWINPPANVPDIANGFDTRYLISFGPFQLSAGAIETVTVAIVGGRSLHTDPLNYSEHLRGHETDSAQIAQYYQGLNFGDLIAKTDSAYAYYGRNYAFMPAGPPENLHVSGWNTDRIDLAWAPSWYSPIREYRLYRGTSPGQYSRITPDNFRDTTFIDTGLQDNTWYYYVITTVKDDDGIEGGPSRELRFNSGQPQIPAGLAATPGNTQITLNWQANRENDIAGYIIRRGHEGQAPIVIDTAQSLTYTDTGLRNGIEYHYCISAFDTYGNESFVTPIVRCIPMGFDSGILLININRLGPYNPDYDSMLAFYGRALGGHEFTMMYGPPSLPGLAAYSTVIWSRDLIMGRSFATASNMDLFKRYLDNGGKLIIEGTRNLVENNFFEDTISFVEGDFRHDYLNLGSAEYPDTVINAEFIGASTPLEEFPMAEVDTARANRIVYPQDQNDGRLFGIGTLTPINNAEVLYNFTAIYPDTSRLHGRPVATLHMGTDFILAAFEFPLYYIKEPASIEILQRILNEFGEVGIDEKAELPGELMLLQNYPNPFNAQTNIILTLPQAGNVRLDIFNILGQKVESLCQGYLTSGAHSITWNADRFSSGLYIARLEYGIEIKNIKMLLLR